MGVFDLVQLAPPFSGLSEDAAADDEFGSRRGMERIRGEINVRQDGDKDGDGENTDKVEDSVSEALADSNADLQLAWEQRLSALGAALTTLIALSIPAHLRRWLDRTANMGAVYYNAEGRGFTQDPGSDYAGKMFKLKRDYEARLQMIRDGSVLMALEGQEGLADDDDLIAPSAAGATVDACGCPLPPPGHCGVWPYGRGCN